VPDWSPQLPVDKRKANPLASKTSPPATSWDQPMRPALNGEAGELALSGAPLELCENGRTFDQDMLVNTIMDAHSTVCISVMDFAPVSLYRGTYDTHSHKYMVGDEVASPVWWPALVDALLHVVSTRKVHARLLISDWAHTSEFIAPYLDALVKNAEAATASRQMETGLLEVKRFRIPGWDKTGPVEQGKPMPAYPGHTRVNHTKYIVTDRRVNIGTSNMTWDYFTATAGASLNANHPQLLGSLQAVFDRDWESQYAQDLLSSRP
jgi:phospholipase D3/4